MKNRGAYGMKKPLAAAKTLGERLRQSRIAWGWSQAQLASALGSNQRLVSHWERDVAKPSAAALSSLSNLLGLSVDALLEGSGFSIPDVPDLDSGGGCDSGRLLRLKAIARLVPEVPTGKVLVLRVNECRVEADTVSSAARALRTGVQEGAEVILVIRKPK